MQLREEGEKRRLNGISKVNRHTHRHTYAQIGLQKASAQRADALKIKFLKQKQKVLSIFGSCSGWNRPYVGGRVADL